MSAQIFYNNGSSSSEVITHLINASDGAGLHFDGASGTYVDCSATTILDGATRMSVEVISATSSTAIGRVLGKDSAASCFKLQANADGTLTFRVNNGSADGTATTSGTYNDGNPKHIVGTWDNATLSIYVNGNLDGTATLAGGAIPNTTDKIALGAKLDSGTTNASNFDGDIYRARLYNRDVSSDVQSLFESASIDFADQWGSQTDLVVNGTFAADTDWTKQSGWTIPGGNVAHCATTDDYALYATASNQTVGKKYRITFEIDNWVSGGVTVDDDYGADKTLYAADGTYTEEFISSTSSTRFFGQNSVTSNLDIKNVTVRAIGAVADFDCSYSNPTQSAIIQNRNADALMDGTAAGGITQIMPIEQLNSKALRVGTSAATPSDGQVYIGDATTTPLVGADDLVLVRGSGDAGVTIRTATSSTGQICFADGNTGNEAYRGYIGYKHGTSEALNLGSGGETRLTIDSDGFVQINGPVGTDYAGATSLGFELTSPGHQRLKVHSTSITGHAVAYDLETGAAGPVAHTGSVKLSGAGLLSLQTTGSDRLTIDSAGKSTFTTAGVVPAVFQSTNASYGSIQLDNTATGGDNWYLMSTADGHVHGGGYFSLYNEDTTTHAIKVSPAGLATFSAGIAVAGTNYAKFTAASSQTVTIADDASITIAASSTNGALVSVQAGSGKAILFFIAYSPIAQILNDADSIGSAADVDGKVCLIKTTTSHTCSLKNRLGVSSVFHITVFGGYVA